MSSGAEFLDRKSALNRDRQGLPDIRDIVIIDDEHIDADRLLATLRVIYGQQLVIRRASNLKAGIELVMANAPDVVLLDDILKPSDEATHSIPMLRRAHYEGPIIVISGQVTRTRRAALVAAGANNVIHKDDVDSVKLNEALRRLTLAPATGTGPTST